MRHHFLILSMLSFKSMAEEVNIHKRIVSFRPPRRCYLYLFFCIIYVNVISQYVSEITIF